MSQIQKKKNLEKSMAGAGISFVQHRNATINAQGAVENCEPTKSRPVWWHGHEMVGAKHRRTKKHRGSSGVVGVPLDSG